jgi:hypothetical protein
LLRNPHHDEPIVSFHGHKEADTMMSTTPIPHGAHGRADEDSLAARINQAAELANRDRALTPWVRDRVSRAAGDIADDAPGVPTRVPTQME